MASVNQTHLHHELHQLAEQTYHLALGLQNAAPLRENKGPLKSVRYLLEIALELEKTYKAIDAILQV